MGAWAVMWWMGWKMGIVICRVGQAVQHSLHQLQDPKREIVHYLPPTPYQGHNYHGFPHPCQNGEASARGKVASFLC